MQALSLVFGLLHLMPMEMIVLGQSFSTTATVMQRLNVTIAASVWLDTNSAINIFILMKTRSRKHLAS
jgi:hypothetical protein